MKNRWVKVLCLVLAMAAAIGCCTRPNQAGGMQDGGEDGGV